MWSGQHLTRRSSLLWPKERNWATTFGDREFLIQFVHIYAAVQPRACCAILDLRGARSFSSSKQPCLIFESLILPKVCFSFY